MSQQGPIIVVADGGRPAFVDALAEAAAFPVVEIEWQGATAAVKKLQPALIVATVSEGCAEELTALANSIEGAEPYVPLIAIGAPASPPGNALPFDGSDPSFARLPARANAALRVRTLHATVLRRLDDSDDASLLPDTDPLPEATVLLVGRGASYPALSVALGQEMGVVGALSIEAGARHLSLRDIDGIVVGEGFSPRVTDAFLTVLSEDARFRHLPVIVAGGLAGVKPGYEQLSSLEIIRGEPRQIVASAAPMIRQQAFENRLNRALKSLDAGGVLDPRTGLLTNEAFDKDFSKAVSDITERGGGLSAARFSFDTKDARTSLDAARILSRLMRRMDFASLQDDGSIIAAFAETDLRMANVIVRRLASVLKHTMLSGDDKTRMDPHVTLATLKANDSAEALLERLQNGNQRAAS